MCEDFERETSISDCGFFTPDGFVDQWVSSAVANPEFQDSECPEMAIVGPPNQLQVSVLTINIDISDNSMHNSFVRI